MTEAVGTGGRGGRIVVVGPEDTVLGLGLLGIEGTVVANAHEAAAALERALATPGVAMVLLGQAWAADLRDRMEAAAVDVDGPLVVEVPDPDGVTGDVPLTERVERVLGMRLEV
ncbi:MAG: V-type ATP synthase subunit F [Trueperaceae bacterium]